MHGGACACVWVLEREREQESESEEGRGKEATGGLRGPPQKDCLCPSAVLPFRFRSLTVFRFSLERERAGSSDGTWKSQREQATKEKPLQKERKKKRKRP